MLCAVSASCGESDTQTLDAEMSQATALLETLGTGVVEQPHVTESKAVRYVTATATAEGDQKAVLAQLEDGLRSTGWVIVFERPIDVGQSPATEGDEVIARDDDVVVRLAVFDRIGTHPSTEGVRWIQLSLSSVTDALSWTTL